MQKSSLASETPTPFPYKEGKTLSLTTGNNEVLQATILQVYEVTFNLVMLVEIRPSKQKRILKLYDRRFGVQRRKADGMCRAMPHTPTTESAWHHYVCAGKGKDFMKFARAHADAFYHEELGWEHWHDKIKERGEPSQYDEVAEEEG